MRGRANKYGAKKTRCSQGHLHDSAKEARRCNDLHLLARAGEIDDLEVQPKFYFCIGGVQVKHDNGRRVGFTPDFSYIDMKSGADVVEDVKAASTRARSNDYPLRKAMFKALFPAIEFREV